MGLNGHPSVRLCTDFLSDQQPNHTINKYQQWQRKAMVAFFCHHLSDNSVDLSDLYVVLSDLYVDLSDLYVDLSLIHLLENVS